MGAVNAQAQALFNALSSSKEGSGCVTFESVAKRLGVSETHESLLAYIQQITSVSTLITVWEDGEEVVISLPLFAVSKVNEINRSLCVQVNSFLVEMVKSSQRGLAQSYRQSNSTH